MTLTDNGIPVTLSGVSFTLVQGTTSTYQFGDLSGLTAAAGTYTLTVNASGIKDQYGNVGTGSLSTSWLLGGTTPTISWANPANIVYGTALSATQLDATASVPGTFTYTPAAGTVLNAGNNQTLSVAFAPTDTADYTTASATATINVQQASTTTSVNAGAPSSLFGQSVTFTATITVVTPGAGTPTGTVIFMDGLNELGTGTLDSAAAATFTTAALALGSHSITAVYSGDTNFTTSTSTVATETVIQASTITDLSSSTVSSVFGQSVTFRATVGAVMPSLPEPTGAVEFLDGATEIGTASLDGTGAASLSIATLGVGGHSITAEYLGDGNFSGSTSTAAAETVNQTGTTTALTSSVSESVYGQSVTFTATLAAVAPGAGTPTGAVMFMDGSNTLGSGTLSGGVAIFTTSTLTVGSHNLTAVYGGDGNFSTSTSAQLSQPVNQASTWTSLNSSASSSVYGQSVTFTATVSVISPGGGIPTGIVTFLDGSNTLGTGTLERQWLGQLQHRLTAPGDPLDYRGLWWRFQ